MDGHARRSLPGFFIARDFGSKTDFALRRERRRSDRKLLNGTMVFDN
jgi:hypothetical protein